MRTVVVTIAVAVLSAVAPTSAVEAAKTPDRYSRAKTAVRFGLKRFALDLAASGTAPHKIRSCRRGRSGGAHCRATITTADASCTLVAHARPKGDAHLFWITRLRCWAR